MKINKHTKKITALTLALSLVTVAALAQEKEQKKKDPFTRKSGAAENTELGEPEKMIVIGLQLAQVPSVNVREWDEEGLTGTEWRNKVQALIKEGKASIVDSVVGNFKSGQRGKFQSVFELRYPTAMQKISESPDVPEFPLSFDRRELGISFEADPVLNAEGDLLDLNFAFNWSRYLGETSGARTASDRVQEGDVLQPQFSEQKVTTNVKMPIGEYQVLTRIEPNETKDREEFDVVVFGRVDLVLVMPIADEAVVEAVEELRLRGTWAEIDAAAWHEAIHSHSLSQWVGGKAWEATKAWEKEGKAKILASPVIRSRSGQRAKVEVGVAMEYQDSFSVPGNADPDEKGISNMKERILGHVLEIDPVLGLNGIIALNSSSTSTSQHGYSVSYRRQEGDAWVPSVQFPKFYESSVTTQVALGKDADLLMGVGTPPLEDGQPDTNRKWVFFAHNNTFDMK